MSKFGSLVAERRQKPGNPKRQKGRHPDVQMPEILRRATGRPRAKRSDPAYTPVTAYIRKDTHIAAKKLLLDEEKEFSELLEELVSAWVQKRQTKASS
jgi:hypothetical protein